MVKSEMDQLYLDLWGYGNSLPVLPPRIYVAITYDYTYSLGGVRLELQDAEQVLAKNVRKSIDEPAQILAFNESRSLVKRGVEYTLSNLQAIFVALGFMEAHAHSLLPSFVEPRYRAYAVVDLYPTEHGVPYIGYLPGDILDHLSDVIQVNGDFQEEMTPEVLKAKNTLRRLNENGEVPASTEAVSALRTMVGFAQRAEACGWSVEPGNTKKAEDILFSMALMVQKDVTRRKAVEQRIKWIRGEV